MVGQCKFGCVFGPHPHHSATAYRPGNIEHSGLGLPLHDAAPAVSVTFACTGVRAQDGKSTTGSDAFDISWVAPRCSGPYSLLRQGGRAFVEFSAPRIYLPSE